MKELKIVAYCLAFLLAMAPNAFAQGEEVCGGVGAHAWVPVCPGSYPPDGCISHRQGCDLDGNGTCDAYITIIYKSNGTACDAGGQPGQCHDGQCLEVCEDADQDGFCDDPDGCIGGLMAADAATNLCWYKDTSIYYKEYGLALAECESSTLGGYDDWRLPTLDELRGTIVNCPSTMPGGSCTIPDPTCPITESNPPDLADEAAQAEACAVGCLGCTPGVPGYAAEFLNDRMDKVWSVDTADDGNWAWVVNFRDAHVYLAREYWGIYVRCVRDFDATPACSDADGDGVCDADDVCPGFDDTIDTDGDGTPDGCDGCHNDSLKTEPGLCGCGVAEGTCGGDCVGPNVAEDAANSLCWQDPEHTVRLDRAAALAYCDGLSLDGYDDWHLPTISELRTVVEGCAMTETTGSCGITDSCLDRSVCGGACTWPAWGGCAFADYLSSILSSISAPNSLWSSSPDTAYPDQGYSISYSNAYIYTNDFSATKDVRCVRDFAAGPCPDADGDGVCDADDICPGFDDTIDTDGDGTPDGCDGCPSSAIKVAPGTCGCLVADEDADLDGIMDCIDPCVGSAAHCTCRDYDVVGTSQFQPTIILSPDGQVTFGMPNWWEDDVYACYNTYLDPAYMFYFSACDLNGSGLVEMQEVLDIYYFALQYPTGGVPSYAVSCAGL